MIFIMKLFVKKATPKKATFTTINKSALKQVKGGGDGILEITQG